jgi:SPP1 gp7 family putative phage head morphogenesis protein|nr:MAG TPA: minor capsid protein [Caudoviricetes sp.]
MNYWEKRFERLKQQQMGKAETVTAVMRREYVKALTALRKEVLDWYYRYAEENEMSLADARKELDTRELRAFQLTLKEYIKLAKKKNLPQKYIKMLDKASIRARLDRSQELYIKTSRYVEELAKSQNLSMRSLLSEVYEDSVYKTAYEAQKLKGKFSTFKEVAKQDIETAVSKPWASDGKDFSQRIWENKAQLMNTLQTEMTRSFMIGEGVAPLINRIQKRFNVSFSNARRLVETETAYVQEKAMLDTYDALDVEQYQILAVLDLKTSDICRHLDKKVFDRKDAKPGITMPPFHCYCRSTTIPYIEGITDSQEVTRAARDLSTGKTVFVEGDLNYEEWYNKYVKNTDTGALTGLKTSNGITIAKLSKHQQERADVRNLDLDGIRDALINPLHIGEIRMDENGRSQRFVGETVTVNVNPDTGVVTTSWATGKRTAKKYKKEVHSNV